MFVKSSDAKWNTGLGFIVQKMVKTLHFQCSDFQFLKMFG